MLDVSDCCILYRSRFERLARLTPVPTLDSPRPPPITWQAVDENTANHKLMAFLEAKVGNYDAAYVPHPLYPEEPKPVQQPQPQLDPNWRLESHAVAMSPEGMVGGSGGRGKGRDAKVSRAKDKAKDRTESAHESHPLTPTTSGHSDREAPSTGIPAQLDDREDRGRDEYVIIGFRFPPVHHHCQT